MEHRISGPGPLLDADGALAEPGWSDSPLLRYDRSAVKAPAWRIKEWDYYCVLARDFGIALTVSDNGYMGFVSATVLDFAARAETTETVMPLLTMGRFRMPPCSEEGVVEVDEKGARIRFEARSGERRLSFSWPDFGAAGAPRPPRTACCAPLPPGDAPRPPADGRVQAGVGLEGEISLSERPGRASMVIATPFAGRGRRFYYNQKINCQDAEGGFRLGKREFRLERGSAFGVLDWGRGVWPWSNSWLWGSASGRVGGRVGDGGEGASFGFNIGYGFGDTSAASENMVFYEGKAHKIGRLAIELDERDFMKPWRAVSEDGRLDLVLSPILDRSSTTDLGVLASIQHQVFGRWSGRAVLDDGREIRVDGLSGFCEKVVNRW
jgi:hypothetical protein